MRYAASSWCVTRVIHELTRILTGREGLGAWSLEGLERNTSSRSRVVKFPNISSGSTLLCSSKAVSKLDERAHSGSLEDATSCATEPESAEFLITKWLINVGQDETMFRYTLCFLCNLYLVVLWWTTGVLLRAMAAAVRDIGWERFCRIWLTPKCLAPWPFWEAFVLVGGFDAVLLLELID